MIGSVREAARGTHRCTAAGHTFTPSKRSLNKAFFEGHSLLHSLLFPRSRVPSSVASLLPPQIHMTFPKPGLVSYAPAERKVLDMVEFLSQLLQWEGAGESYLQRMLQHCLHITTVVPISCFLKFLRGSNLFFPCCRDQYYNTQSPENIQPFNHATLECLTAAHLQQQGSRLPQVGVWHQPERVCLSYCHWVFCWDRTSG